MLKLDNIEVRTRAINGETKIHVGESIAQCLETNIDTKGENSQYWGDRVIGAIRINLEHNLKFQEHVLLHRPLLHQ